MAKTMAKVLDAITGNGKLDLDALRVEADPEVIQARKAEDEAAARAHQLEDVAQLEAARERADGAYTEAAGEGDEAAVRDARRAFIAADEALRARREHVRRAQLAAVEARRRREAVEVLAEERIKARVHDQLAAITARIQRAVESELIPAFEEAEKVIDAAEAVASWGSPAARRHGWILGLGSDGKALFRGRGNLASTGAHTLGAVVLPAPYVEADSVYGQFKAKARDLGLIG